MANQKKRLGAFRLTHLIGCVGLVFWSYWFYSEHTPARTVWRNMTHAQEHRAREAAMRGQRPAIRHKIAEFKVKYRAIKPIVLPDVFVGTVVLVFFSVSTGVFVKRLDVFLRMSGSGQVAAVRGIGIQSQTLESNIGRKGGIQ